MHFFTIKLHCDEKKYGLIKDEERKRKNRAKSFDKWRRDK